MKGDEEEASPFRRSSKVARSPMCAPLVDSVSETDGGAKKREVRSGKTPEKSLEKRSRKSPVMACPSELTEMESEDMGAGGVEEMELGGGDIGEIWQTTSEIKQWLAIQYKSKRISLVSYDEILKKIRKIRHMSNEMVKENAKLDGRLEVRGRMEELVEKKVEEIKVAPVRKTFAETVAIPKTTGFKRVTPSPKVIMIQSKEGGKEPEEVKKIMKEAINSGEMGINVRRVRKTARGVMVEMESEEQVKKIEESVGLARKGLLVERMKKRKPRVMIYDIDDEVPNEEMIKNIFEQNLAGGKLP